MIYLVDIEPLETRYTAQWKTHLPAIIASETGQEVFTIEGGEVPSETTPGAFLNFGGTTVYKSRQGEKIGELFTEGKVNDGDYFLFTDAWNPFVLQLKYVSQLLGKKIKIGGLWHAGSYDPQDFLGRLIGNKEPWVAATELAMAEAYDHNFFATQFHIDLFSKSYPSSSISKIRTGWEMRFLWDEISPFTSVQKENLILFPHRMAPEKQPEIFKDLSKELTEYTFVFCQEKSLTKAEYHSILGKAKMVFSANLQETLGISWVEGAIARALPLVPDRLSYSEMKKEPVFFYPSEWTESFESYKANKPELVAKIRNLMELYDKLVPLLNNQLGFLYKEFFTSTVMIDVLKGVNNEA